MEFRKEAKVTKIDRTKSFPCDFCIIDKDHCEKIQEDGDCKISRIIIEEGK